MSFTPVNEIERLLVAATGDPAARPAFYRGLTEQELFVIAEGRKQEGGQPLQIRQVDFDGEPRTPIFTSVERISADMQGEAGFAAVNGRILFGMLRGKELVMNPGSQYGKTITAWEVDSILDGSIFQPDQTPDVGEKQILLAQPRDYPRHVTEPLSELFAKHREVTAAYLAQAFVGNDGEGPHTMVGLEVEGDWKVVSEAAGIVVREAAKPGEIVDFVRVDPNRTDTISDYMCKKTTPFYKR